MWGFIHKFNEGDAIDNFIFTNGILVVNDFSTASLV